MNQSNEIDQIAAAIAKAQASMGSATKNSSGQVRGNRNYKYADLAAIVDTYRQPFAEQGLSVVQRPQPSDTGVRIQTMILHTSGQWIADDGLYMPADQNNPQAYGSAMTYARRYGISALVGIVTDDDDGKAATDAANAKQQPLTDEHRQHIINLAQQAGDDLDTATRKAGMLKTVGHYERSVQKLETAIRDAESAAQDMAAETEGTLV